MSTGAGAVPGPPPGGSSTGSSTGTGSGTADLRNQCPDTASAPPGEPPGTAGGVAAADCGGPDEVSPFPDGLSPGSSRERSRETGEEREFPQSVRYAILARDQQEWGGCVLRPRGGCQGGLELHHRRLRGTGGTAASGSHDAANGVALCTWHHAWAHRYRGKAEPQGLIVSRYRDPAEVPLVLDGRGTRLWLTADGRYRYRQAEAEAEAEAA